MDEANRARFAPRHLSVGHAGIPRALPPPATSRRPTALAMRSSAT